MSMFKKFLLKRQFWPLPRKAESLPCFIYHTEKEGGIYAYLIDHGVIIKSSRGMMTFQNFQDLTDYLDSFDSGRQMRFANFQKNGNPYLHLPYERIPI